MFLLNILGLSVFLTAVPLYLVAYIVVTGDEDGDMTFINVTNCVVQTTKASSVTGMTKPIRAIIALNSTVFATASDDLKITLFSNPGYSNLYDFATSHTLSINKIVITSSIPGGSNDLLITASDDNTCRVWSTRPNTTYGLQINRTFSQHTKAVKVLIILANGLVASGSTDGYVYIWKHINGSVVSWFKINGTINSIAQVSGNVVAIGTNSSIQFWEWVNNGTFLYSFNTSRVDALQLYTSNILLYGNYEGKVGLIDTSSGTEIGSSVLVGAPCKISDLAITSSLYVGITCLDSKIVYIRRILNSSIAAGCSMLSSPNGGDRYSIMAFNPWNSTINMTMITSTTTSTSTTRTTTASTSSTSKTSTTTSTSTTRTTSASTTTSKSQSTATSITSSIHINNSEKIIEILYSLQEDSFGFSELTPTVLVDILSSGLDASNCIINCSSHGLCSVTNMQLTCQCMANYTGEDCSISLDPCTSSPCINNGTCVTTIINITTNNMVEYDFICACNELYYGPFCQNKINLCANVTCSGSGKCVDKGSEAICECFYLYSGTDCQVKESKKDIITTVTSVTTVVALAIIASFYVTIVLLDMINLIKWLQSPPANMPKTKNIQKVSYAS